MVPLHVAVGVVRDTHGRVLVARRPPDRHQGGRWEFSGGKVEPGESITRALQRELAEELGIDVQATSPLIRIAHDYGDRRVVLEVMSVDRWIGEARGLEGQPLDWRDPEALRPEDFPAANRGIISALRLPAQYVISADCETRDSWLMALDRVLSAGGRLVQFRVRLRGEARQALAAKALRRCHAAGARLVINGDVALARALDADGVHLNARQLATVRERPLGPDKWVAASCHDPRELRRAAAIGVDFAVLGPVAATASHPDAVPLGWARFSEWAVEAPFPVYALGGMTWADLAMARSVGGQGIAGISGFWTQAGSSPDGAIPSGNPSMPGSADSPGI